MEKKELQGVIDAAYATGMNTAFEMCSKMIDERIGAAMDFGTKLGAQMAAEAAARETAKMIDENVKKARDKQVDKRYQNTKLLLKNYRRLNDHYKEAVYDLKAVLDESDRLAEVAGLMRETLTDEHLVIRNIERSAARTQVIMAHVNKMLDVYRNMCDRSTRKEDQRRWRVLQMMYLDETTHTAAEIAEAEFIDPHTVYKDIDKTVEDLTPLLFGIDGLKFT